MQGIMALAGPLRAAGDLSLVAPVTVVAVAALLAATLLRVAWSSRRGDRLLALRVVALSVIATTGLALLARAGGSVTSDVPRWYYPVASLPFIGPAMAAAGWRVLGGRSRALAITCLPLGLVVAMLIVNQHYQYWPTLDALMGKDHSDPMLERDEVLRLVAAGPAIVPAADSGDPVGVPDATGATRSMKPVPNWSGLRPSSTRSGATLDPVVPTEGRLVDMVIPGTMSGFHARTARIWLPPAFLADPTRPRPVVILVGGTPSWTSDWTRSAQLDLTADRVAAAHRGEAPLLVMVDANGSALGDTECVDRPGAMAETYLTVDVRAFMATHFAVPLDRASWGIAGYSEGGTCAVTVALRHPDRFAAFVDLAGDAHPCLGDRKHTIARLFGGSEQTFAAHDPAQLLARPDSRALAGWFGSGRADGSARRDTGRLATLARSAGLAVEEESFAGGHDYGFVTQALRRALPWISDQLRVPVPATTTPR